MPASWFDSSLGFALQLGQSPVHQLTISATTRVSASLLAGTQLCKTAKLGIPSTVPVTESLALQSVCAMVGPRMMGLRNIVPELHKINER